MVPSPLNLAETQVIPDLLFSRIDAFSLAQVCHFFILTAEILEQSAWKPNPLHDVALPNLSQFLTG